jgi:hypothetical protein
MYAMVQCMRKMDNFQRVLLSMKEDVDWPTGKVWKTWQSNQNHYQPTNTTTPRDLTMALQKKLAQISAVEVKFKQSLSEDKKVEVLQGCAGDNYAHIIVVTDGLIRSTKQDDIYGTSNNVQPCPRC